MTKQNGCLEWTESAAPGYRYERLKEEDEMNKIVVQEGEMVEMNMRGGMHLPP